MAKINLATTHNNSKGRKHGEIDTNCFLEDRNRIICSKSFRRLQYKTQVFVSHEGDHYRNRLTHSLEVAANAKLICRGLAELGIILNEDLAECIGLAHDLGHTPFGHCGQNVLNNLMEEYEGFEHNYQSVRVLTELDGWNGNNNGMDLCFEVVEGVIKHRSPSHMMKSGKFVEYDLPKRASIEAQIANFADELTYNCHDLEDGHASGLINLSVMKTAEKMPLFMECLKKAIKEDKELQENSANIIAMALKILKDTLINDAVTNIYQNITENNIKSKEDCREFNGDLIQFSKKIKLHNGKIKKFLNKELYDAQPMFRRNRLSKIVIEGIFNVLMEDPRMMPEKYYKIYLKKLDKHGKNGGPRTIADYISGMTDRFAIDEHRRFFNVGDSILNNQR